MLSSASFPSRLADFRLKQATNHSGNQAPGHQPTNQAKQPTNQPTSQPGQATSQATSNQAAKPPTLGPPVPFCPFLVGRVPGTLILTSLLEDQTPGNSLLRQSAAGAGCCGADPRWDHLRRSAESSSGPPNIDYAFLLFVSLSLPKKRTTLPPANVEVHRNCAERLHPFRKGFFCTSMLVGGRVNGLSLWFPNGNHKRTYYLICPTKSMDTCPCSFPKHINKLFR